MALTAAVAAVATMICSGAFAAPARAADAAPQPWSDPATWGSSVPGAGARVTIPAGKTVLLDRSVALEHLTINGALVFARRDILLEADWINVYGRLAVGTEAAPFLQSATIRLRDHTPGENIIDAGDKVIVVSGGTLELHGEPRPGWTKLGATARAGMRTITLATSPGWRVGDRVAIASSDFARSQDEDHVVTAVSGRTLTLDAPLESTHFGVLQTIAGRTVDERAEVALLSRNVTVEGEEASSAGGFGAQIMIKDGAQAQVENTELQRVGQAGILRRYPIHFHMLGDAATSYVRQTSIHHSSNRCITVHGTNKMQVQRNVCYMHRGHGIFLEDGFERGNLIEGNLGMGTKAPEASKRLLPSDESPATFWITNPDNIVRGNVAAGSEGHGFWIALPEHPTGLSALLYPGQTRAMWNRRMALTQFSNNTTHSNGEDGLHFDSGPKPDGTTETTHHHAHQVPADENSPTLVTNMTGLHAWKNREHGAWLRGSEHLLRGAVLSNNGAGATFASNDSYLQDSLVVGETANFGTPESWEQDSGQVGRDGRSLPQPWKPGFPIRGFEFYDGRVGAMRTTFANFQPYRGPDGRTRQESALGYKLDDDFSIHPRNMVSGARFVNAKRLFLESPQVGHDGDISAVFLDADGSVTGTAGRSVMTRNPFLFGARCALNTSWNAELCTGAYTSLIVGAPGLPAKVKPVKVQRANGRTQTLRASSGDDDDEATTTVLANQSYRVAFNGGTPARTRFVLFQGRGKWLRVALPRAASFKVTHWDCDMGQPGEWCYGRATSLAALAAQDRPGYFYADGGDANPATGTLHLKLTSPSGDWDELVVGPR